MTDKQKKNQKLDVSHIQMPLYSNWTETIPASFINALKSKMYVVCYAEILSKLRNKSIWIKLVHYIEPEKLFSF